MTFDKITRRRLLSSLAGSALFLPGTALAQAVKKVEQLQPGEFTWHPEASPSGPVAIVVSLDEQTVNVYRNGIRIAVSTCSTGKKGHETPTGVFTILQKDKHHHSSTYNNAPMPNMNRLTWQGVALHAGHLPGYPASHGCIRLPLEFSEKLFGITHIGTPVIIAGGPSAPRNLTHPGFLLTDDAGKPLEAAVEKLKHQPKDWADDETMASVSVLASTSDMKAYLFVNGEQTGSAPLEVIGQRLIGEHVLMLKMADDGSLGWVGITQTPDPTQPQNSEVDIVTRLKVPDDFRQKALDAMTSSLTLIITDLPATPETRSGDGFVIMNS